MRWKGRRQSSNIEDRRSSSPGGFGGLGGLGGGGGGGLLRLLPLVFRFLGFKGTLFAVLALGAYMYFSGGGLGGLLGGMTGPGVQSTQTGAGRGDEGGAKVEQSPQEQELAEFVAVVLADTEETWHSLFKAAGKEYEEPHLVLYRGAVNSACGLGQAAMGPFYCPGDRKVYLDLSFFDDLKRRHDAPGDFAQAYVVAHEIGHHVQTLLGISDQVQRAKRGLDEAAQNALSVKQELQADCFAGIWGHHASRSRQLLESGDIDEGLNAASAIGDDRLQKQARGYVSPESFTHGSSKQRVRWFRTGLEKGDVAACNTFKADAL
ncbi:MAG: zinc metallopeptidase [Chromatiaceae bacterium]|nr:zinc metallopeptidase [Gammaproteobacteria bacterium]MCP5300781.1 zinc metallopeptidase [Chromatiaceae bacterium]MCP5422853.1 zinc metallopeptidase [Chromatiaceae bacterium]